MGKLVFGGVLVPGGPPRPPQLELAGRNGAHRGAGFPCPIWRPCARTWRSG